MQETREQKYLKGAAILAAATIFVKIIGAVYKIPIFNILDDEGRGSFQVTYNVYTLILTISTAGIPAAMSRLVSSANASGKPGLVKRYFSSALPAFVLIGVVAMLAMFVFADAFAGLMNDSLAAPGIRVLAPAVFFACIISVYRGYAQGFEYMVPTAASQMIEVVCKAAFGIAAAMWLSSMNYATNIVSAGAIMGVTVGMGLCVPLLVLFKRKLDRKQASAVNESEKVLGSLHVFGRLMKVSIPITLSASFMSIMTFVDTGVVLGRLQTGALMLSEAEARAEFGIYTLALTVYNLPLALIVPISISIIPAIAAALARRRADEANSIMQSSVKLVNLLAMPAAAGLMVLATPIMVALYDDPRELTSAIMTILGAASFFAGLQYITTAILQANGHERIALLTFPIGAVLKIILCYILAGNSNFGIIGSPIGTLACFIVISLLNFVFIKARIKEGPKYFRVFIKPLLCTAFMAAASRFLYDILYRHGSGVIGEGRFTVIACLAVSIFIGIAVYAVLIVAARAITKEDMKLVPKGEKLAKILRIR